MPQSLTIEEIKKEYPNQWVLLALRDNHKVAPPETGIVLLSGKDYLELCYKASQVAKNVLTTILYTGEPANKNRKWLKYTVVDLTK